jgi:hypothetical protein
MARSLSRRGPEDGARRGIGEKLLLALETFTGLTAVAGGVMLLARPDGSLMQMAPSALAALAHNTPFSDFLMPGLALAVIVGGGMLGTATLLWQHRPYALELGIASGVALVLFEIVELSAIGFMPLQAFEAIVGLLVVALAAQQWAAAYRPVRQALR